MQEETEGGQMLTISIENVHDITVSTSQTETVILFHDRRGSDVRLEMSRNDAEFLIARLQEAFRKI
jgi:hypothetical protein